jgi:hypothetical protein
MASYPWTGDALREHRSCVMMSRRAKVSLFLIGAASLAVAFYLLTATLNTLHRLDDVELARETDGRNRK